MTDRSARIALAALLALSPALALGDAVMRSEAMFASSIAEIYVDGEGVRLELEMGVADVTGAFRDLLPDELHQRMGLGDEPFEVRVARFLEEGFVVVADEVPLAGELRSIGPATRVRRDEITGVPLPEDGEEETVVNATFHWHLEGGAARLDFRVSLPRQASIGFVAYHDGIAVNDFRYLTASQVLVPDWDDPWYSAFEQRALRRQFFAPMTGFIYVEPYEVRKEIVVRPRDMQRHVDLGLDGRDTIPVEMQADIRNRITEFLAEHHPVTIDGMPAEPVYARADFLERTLRTSRVVDPPVPLDANAAILGVKFIYPHESFPERVTMRWDLFDDKVQVVPVSAVDPAGPFPQFLEPGLDVLEWQNFIRVPVMPEMAAVRAPPGPLERAASPGRWVLLVLTLVWTFVLARRVRAGADTSRAGALVALAAAATVAAWWLHQRQRLDADGTRALVDALLTNVYRAFDFREEGDVYDVLARSVDGDLLREVYLEVRRGLVLASQGGASARVKDVDVVELEAAPAGRGGIAARVTWQVRAAVGHWGHIHERRNEYVADLRLQPVAGAWKLTGVEVLDELRL